MVHLCVCAIVSFFLAVTLIGVGAGLALFFSPGLQPSSGSNPPKSQFTIRTQESRAATPLAIVSLDGFKMTAPAFCDGDGVDISSHTEKTLTACRDACLGSMPCRAFQFSPNSAQFCTVYDHSTHTISSHGAISGCYVQISPSSNVHHANDFLLIGGVPCDDTNVCTLPEVCDGNTCQRMNEAVDVSMQCANLTNEFNEPDVPVIGHEAMILAALKNSPNKAPIHLSQSNFSQGHFDIAQSGYYKFIENVTIPWVNLTLNIAPQHLGQTIGIRVMANDVVIDLNGHTLQLDNDMQRFEPFVNLIQLNNNNFPEGVLGFPTLIRAERVIIFSSTQKGTLKLATHFGISGIQNNDVVIRNLRIESCWLGGISLTDARNVDIRDVVVDNRQLRNLWTPYFQVIVQLRRRLYQIVEHMTTQSSTSPSVSMDEWRSMLHYVEDRVVNARWAISPTIGRVLGNAFGIQVKNMLHGKSQGGRNIKIENTSVKNIRVGRSEVISIHGDNDMVLMDADHNVFEWDHFFLNDGSRRTCGPNEAACINVQKLNDIRLKSLVYLCSQQFSGIFCVDGLVSKLTQNSGANTLRPRSGVDMRGHIPKGAFGIRFVGVQDAILNDVKIENIDNVESTANDVDAVQNHYESPILWRGREHAKNIFKGHMAFGFYGERSENVKLNSVRVERVKSVWGSTIGVGFGDLSRNIILRDVFAQVEKTREFASETVKLPNLVPYGMPFYVEEDMLSCMHIVDITGVGEFRTGPKHRNVLAVAPVFDCETATSSFCDGGPDSAGPTQCATNINVAQECVANTALNNTCEPIEGFAGFAKTLCCDGAFRTYSTLDSFVACGAAQNGICRCPSDRPYLCHPSSNGQRACEISPQLCSNGAITGDGCPKMNQFAALTPNCPTTPLASTNTSVVLTCRDQTTCLAVEADGSKHWDCCKIHAGRLKCPRQWPYMCASVRSRCGNDHCCSSAANLCESTYGGLLSDSDKSNCPLPLSLFGCKDDSQCTVPGQTCDASNGKCMGYLACSEENNSMLASCVNHQTCDASQGASCCRTLSPKSSIFRCPAARKYMCKDLSCDGDHCCVRLGSYCAYKGGVVDACPVRNGPPPTCRDYPCMDTHLVLTPNLECTNGICSSEECCVPRPTCASANVNCTLSATRRDSLICDANCTQDACCEMFLKCESHSCPDGYGIPTSKSLEWCTDGQCSNTQCCFPRCNTAFPTDASCSTQLRSTIVSPESKLDLCTSQNCTASQCCADSCNVVDCIGSTFYVDKVGRPTGYCGEQGCTLDVCCSLTCASHTCALGTDVPGELTGVVCDSGGCDDIKCGCRMQCATYWDNEGCSQNLLRNPSKGDTLCRSLDLCDEDCCVEATCRVVSNDKTLHLSRHIKRNGDTSTRFRTASRGTDKSSE